MTKHATFELKRYRETHTMKLLSATQCCRQKFHCKLSLSHKVGCFTRSHGQRRQRDPLTECLVWSERLRLLASAIMTIHMTTVLVYCGPSC